MSLMISKSSSYAIQALVFLTVHSEKREYIPIAEIADKLSIPYHFLKKILADLVQHGLILSYRSSKGGIMLAKPAKRITLLDVITLIDGTNVFNECLIGLPDCGEAKPCPLHSQWAIERNRLRALFATTNLADVANRIELRGYRIAP